METHMNLKSGRKDTITSSSTRGLDLPPSLELQSNILNAGRDIYFNVNSGYVKQSLPDTRQLAHWLSSLNQHQFHKDISDKVIPGTGEWVFNSPEFMDWLDRKTNILWGTGIPGAGKTCLSSIIINHLIHCERKTVVFFYCQYKEQPSINEVLSCLLKQMIESSEVASQYVAMTLYTSCTRTDTRPSRSELSKSLIETARKLDSLFFVVDALDELSDDTRFEMIAELASLHYPLLMTSRPLPNLLDLTPIHFDIRPPEHDFDTFISATISRVSKLRPFLRDPGLRREIIKTIQNKCDGMLLLAALQIEALTSAGIINAHTLREAVNRLPDTLNNQYRVTLQRIQSQSPEESDLALRAILWVTHATGYLQADELLEALTVNTKVASVDESQRTTEETLISVCLGLLTVEKESSMVRLIHFTLQEFFEAQDVPLLKTPHEYIADVCAIYIMWIHVNYPSFTSYNELFEHKPKIPLIEYACYNLGYHTHQAINGDTAHLPTHVARLFTERGCAPIPLRPLEDRIDFGNAIHFAAAYGLVSLFETNIGAMEQQTRLGCTPLFYACLGGHSILVEHIIGQHQPSLTCRTGSGATLLHAAVQGGNISVVKMLLSMCGPAVASSDSTQLTPSPVEGDIRIDINAQMSDGRSALYIASEEGDLPVVKALLDCSSVNTNLSQEFGSSPLHISSFNGHEGTVRLLLECPGIDVNARESDGWTALHNAAYHGQESIVRLLLNITALDIHALTSKKLTPLHCAVQGRNSLLLALLLNYPGIKVNAKDLSGLTPLHYAAHIGYDLAVQMLLGSKGIEVSAEDNNGFTPLHNAAAKAHMSIIRLLLSVPGTNINTKSTYGHSLLHLAAANGHEKVVLRLLECSGIDANARAWGSGWTALHYAACNGHEGIVRALLGSPTINLEAKELIINTMNTPTDIRSSRGCTPLSLACEYGHVHIVRLLLDRSLADINNVDDDGDTPLMCAAYNGHASVARLLLDQPEVHINVQDKEHRRTALSKACDASKSPAISGIKTEVEAYQFIALLLEHKDIDVNLADDEGRTPLHYASHSGFREVVELLEGRGAIMRE